MSWLHVLASCRFKMRWPAADYGTSSLRVDTCWKLHLLPCKSISLYANIEYGEAKVEKETQIKVLTCQLCDGHMPQAGANVNGDSVLVPYRVIWQRFCVSIILNLAFCCFFPKQVYLWGSILEKNTLDTLVGALGLVGRGFGPAGRAGLGWAWCWACWARWVGWAWCWAWGLAVLGALAGLGVLGVLAGLGVVLGVGFGRAGRAGLGWAWGLAMLGALAGLGVVFKVEKYTIEVTNYTPEVQKHTFRLHKVYFQSTKVYSESTKEYFRSTKVYFQSTKVDFQSTKVYSHSTKV